MNRRISAVSLNTFREYFFTPALVILIIFMLLVPFLCSKMSGDGTAEGKFKVFVTYSFLISSIIFTLTNISIACSLISSEWKKKTLLTIDVKPIKRWEIILGKWFGILTINFVLIICFLSAMAFSSILVSHDLKKNFPEARNIFTTETELFSLSADESPAKTNSESTSGIYTVPAKESKEWTFKGIRKLPGNLYLSYRFETSLPEGQNISGYWLVGNNSLPNPFELGTSVAKDKVHRLQIPNEAVSNDGELKVIYSNIDPANVSVLFPKSDFKILYPQGNYWINLLKGGINLLILVTFICSVGIFFSCIVSNLTAVLATSVLVFTSYMHDFIDLMIKSIFSESKTQETISLIQRLSYPILKFMAFILPPLNKALPHSYIGNFLLIPPAYLIALFIRIILLGALPLLIIAMIYLSHRELEIPNE